MPHAAKAGRATVYIDRTHAMESATAQVRQHRRRRIRPGKVWGGQARTGRHRMGGRGCGTVPEPSFRRACLFACHDCAEVPSRKRDLPLTVTIDPAGALSLDRQPDPLQVCNPPRLAGSGTHSAAAAHLGIDSPSFMLAQHRPSLGPAVWWLSGALDLQGSGCRRHESLRSGRGLRARIAPTIMRQGRVNSGSASFFRTILADLCSGNCPLQGRAFLRDLRLRFRETLKNVNGFCSGAQTRVKWAALNTGKITHFPDGTGTKVRSTALDA
jgi:hypothetical protein